MKTNWQRFIILTLVIFTVLFSCYQNGLLLLKPGIPFFVQAEGIPLDRSKTYVLCTRTYSPRSQDTIPLYINQELSPSVLGWFSFKDEWQLSLHKSNILASNDTSSNPLLPWAVNAEGKIYFSPGMIVGEKQLLQGIKFNSIFGNISDRVKCLLIKNGGKSILQINSEGIGVTYPVFSNASNIYELYFGKAITFDTSSSSRFLFTFFKPGNTLAYKLRVQNRGWYSPQFELMNSNNSIIQSGKGSFQLHGVAFKFKRSQPLYFLLLFTIYIIAIIYFTALRIKELRYSANPFSESILMLRILFNCLLLLGSPLLFHAHMVEKGRVWILLLAICLNVNWLMFFKSLLQLSFVQHIKQFFYNNHKIIFLSKLLLRKSALIIRGIFFCIFLILSLLLFFKYSGERVYGVPVLMITKILLLILVFVVPEQISYRENGKGFLSGVVKIFYRNFDSVIFILFATIIVLRTHDFGTLLFTSFGLLLKTFLKSNNVRDGRLIALVMVIAFAGLFTFYWVQPEAIKENRKIARLFTWIIPPSSDFFKYANEADKESSSDLYMLLKTRLQDPFTNANEITIPSNWRTVFYSDYAVAFSYYISGLPWLLLFAATTFLIILYSTRLLFIIGNQFQIGPNQFFSVNTNLSRVFILLLSYSIVQMVFPFMSNMLTAFLTGQSVPLISTSNWELIFIILILQLLQYFYNSREYYKILPNPNIPVAHFLQLSKRMRTFFLVVVTIICSSVCIRMFFLAKTPEEMLLTFNKSVSVDSINNTTEVLSKEELVHQAKNFKKNAGSKLSEKEKSIFRNIASYFFTGKGLKELQVTSREINNSEKRWKRRTAIDSFEMINKIKVADIDGTAVYSLTKLLNGRKEVNILTNTILWGYPLNSTTVIPDLQANLNRNAVAFIRGMGRPFNTVSIMVVENSTGNILASASYPNFANSNDAVVRAFNKNNPYGTRFLIDDKFNASDIYSLPGSIVKPLLAYLFLQMYPNAASWVFEGVTFEEYLQNSSDVYSAHLLRTLLSDRTSMDNILKADFDMALINSESISLFDRMPDENTFNRPLNRMNAIYRLSIGQQNKIPFSKLVEIFARISSGHKVELSYFKNESVFEPLSISQQKLKVLKNAMNGAFDGTAAVVKNRLLEASLFDSTFICKTGSAQLPRSTENSTSSFIFASTQYTIGIQLCGAIPENSRGFTAKDLFNRILPVLIEYRALQ